MQQRRASAHTIASYRDTFRMLLQFVPKRLRKAPSAFALDDIDAPLVMAFLDDMELTHGVTARTRNLRLTVVHSFFRLAAFAAFDAPTHSALIQRVLAISAKRFTRTLVRFLSRPEVDALLAAPDQRSWSAWTREPPLVESQPLFPNARGGTLSLHGVHYMLSKHVTAAITQCLSLKEKRVVGANFLGPSE